MGYGRTTWNYGSYKKTIALHRAVYCKHNNIVPGDIEGKVIMHTCDNPRCINPEHLKLGTHEDNMADMVSKGRSADVAGGLNPNSKLTASQVEDIRNKYSTGNYTYAALGRVFNVGYKQISRIVNNKQWVNKKES